MTRDDILRMAREAGARPSNHPEMWDIWKFNDASIEAFYLAAFAAGEAAERDRMKRLVEDMQNELRQCRMAERNT